MKITFLLLGLLSLMVVTAQPAKGTYDYYITKSKRQKTVGNIFVVAGAGLIFGALITQGQTPEGPLGIFPEHFERSMTLLVGGLALGTAAVPFLISGRKNANKAASIGVSGQTVLLPLQGNLIGRKIQPSVVLKISL